MKLFGESPSEHFRRVLEPVRMPVSQSPALLHVVGGLHTGAHIKINQSPTTLGRSFNSDIVLRDIGVKIDHAEIIFDGTRWLIRAIGDTHALSVMKHKRRGRYLRECIHLGSARLVLSQHATESAIGHYQPRPSYYPATVALIAGALISTSLVFATINKPTEPDASLKPPAHLDVGISAWPDVSVNQLEDGSRQILGYVDTIEDRQRLLTTLDWSHSDNAAKLYSGDLLETQFREVLNSQAINVRYVGKGVIRLNGVIADQAELDHLMWVVDEFEKFIRIDDLTEFMPAPRKPARRPLPFQIVDVIPGAAGSFGDQNGNRYFIGARLPDGSILVGVDEDAVEFRLNNEKILYPIK